MRPSSVLPAARLAILYQNDEFGKGYPGAIKAELGSKAQSKYKIPQSITFKDSLRGKRAERFSSAGSRSVLGNYRPAHLTNVAFSPRSLFFTQILSMMIAGAMPPAAHIVTRPRLRSRRSSSSRMVPIRMEPVAPIG